MNNKKYVIVIAILGVLILMFSTLSWASGWCVVNGNDPVVLVEEDGNMLMLKNDSPVNRRLHKYKSGDKILIFHGGVQEIFPGDTSAYFCMRLARGTISDIPDDLVRSLQSYGILP